MTSLLYSRARIFGVLLAVVFLLPLVTLAQQLRIIDGTTTEIDPTAYRAYYGKLSGEPHTYTFTTDEDSTPVRFILLVPDTPDAKTNITATLTGTNLPESDAIIGDGTLSEWMRFFDTAGRDSYLAGPALGGSLSKGTYEVRITSPESNAPYVLVASGKETFSIAETIRRYGTVPSIKSDFFGKSPSEAYLTPLLLWPVLGVLILAALVVFVFIVVFRRRSSPDIAIE